MAANGATDVASLDKLLTVLKAHDRNGRGLISQEDLSALLKALDTSGYWTESRLQLLFDAPEAKCEEQIHTETFVRGLYSEAKAAELGVDYEAVRADLVRLMDQPDWDDGSYAPLLIRLAWHSSGTYSRFDGTGGSNGATMRHALEAGDKENAGLAKARALLEPLQARHPGLSHADLWILAAYVAIEHTQGPRMRFTGGRKDAGADKAIAPGRLPGAETGLADGFNVDSEGRLEGWENVAQHIRGVFGRLGFNDRETVALISGGHVYGRCHPEHSGYAGAWVENPTYFSNEYAADLIGDRWQAVTEDFKMSDGGEVPDEVRPIGIKRQYIDLTKYDPDEEEEATLAAMQAPDASGYPPGRYTCVSQWVNARELPDVSSDIIGRYVQDTTLSLLTVKVFGTAVRGLAERGGWVSIIGSAGKTLFERVGDLDLQALAGKYRAVESNGAPLRAAPGQAGKETGRLKANEEFSCGQLQFGGRGDQAGSLYGQLTTGANNNAWVPLFTPSRGLVAELIVQGYNEQPRKAIKGQTGHQMMLVTDMVLLWDPAFREPLEVYAEDADLLKEEFGDVFRRLTELGCPWSQDKPAAGGSCPATGATTGVCPVMR